MRINKFLFWIKKKKKQKTRISTKKRRESKSLFYSFPVYSSLPGLGEEELIIAYRTKITELWWFLCCDDVKDRQGFHPPTIRTSFGNCRCILPWFRSVSSIHDDNFLSFLSFHENTREVTPTIRLLYLWSFSLFGIRTMNGNFSLRAYELPRKTCKLKRKNNSNNAREIGEWKTLVWLTKKSFAQWMV